MGRRCTDAQARERVAAALQLLRAGAGSAAASHYLATDLGISVRQARRYVNAAALELCEPLNQAEFDRQALLCLYRLDLIASGSVAVDPSLAVRASRAHATALAQLWRAVNGGGRLRSRGATPAIPPPMLWRPRGTIRQRWNLPPPQAPPF